MRFEGQTDVMDRLSRERPQIPDEVLAPDGPLGRRTYARLAVGGSRVRRGPRAAVAAAMVTIVIAAAAAVSVISSRSDESQGPRIVVAAADMQQIVSRSNEAMSSTGRARVAFVLDEGRVTEQVGTSQVSFSGDDLEMIIDFEGRHGRPGFQAVNRTVDGKFYLLDVTPGGQRWYLDAAARSGGDPFTVDPRTFVGLLQSGARLDQVGRQVIDGVSTRHIKAVDLDGLGDINLGLGPIDAGRIANLHVWVDGQNIVRQMLLEVAWREEVSTEGLRVKIKHPDGRVTVEPMVPGSSQSPLPSHINHTARYTVRFMDLGSDIRIAPPADAVVIEGQG